jgi:hypothetical protein
MYIKQQKYHKKLVDSTSVYIIRKGGMISQDT